MKIYVCNAFSLSMLDREIQNADRKYGSIIGERVVFPRIPRPVDDPRAFIANWTGNGAEVVSILGHASTRGLFEAVLGIPVPVNRRSVKLADDEYVLVGQYVGPRLPDGATELPDGATLEWWIV